MSIVTIGQEILILNASNEHDFGIALASLARQRAGALLVANDGFFASRAERSVLAARGAPQLEAGHPAEREQRLIDGTGGSMHERALASLRQGRAVKELVCGRPAQGQRGRRWRAQAARSRACSAGPR